MAANRGAEIKVLRGWLFMSTRRNTGKALLPTRLGMDKRW
jgi:hypothetical protein